MSTSTRTQDDPRRWLFTAAILAILAVAAFLRFDGLAGPSLWFDEILHYEKAHAALEEPWSAWLTGLSVDRENGSLYYATQLLALRFFDDELGVRLMPALAGLAAIAVLFLVGLSATASCRVAALAAVLLAVSPLHVYYSREGRPYAAAMLLATLLLLIALEHRRRSARVAAYGLCLAAAYLGAVAVPVLLAFGSVGAFEWLRRRRCGHFVLAATIGLLIGFLRFPTAERLGNAVGPLNQTARWEITSPLSAVAFDRLLASLSVSGVDRGSSNGLSYLFLALAVWGALHLLRKRPSAGIWIMGLGPATIAGSLVLLVAFDHWYNVRYTAAGLPAFLLLVGAGIVDLWDRLGQLLRRAGGTRLSWAGDAVVPLVLAVALAPAWRTARSEPWDKPDWRGLAERIDRLALPSEPVIARGGWAEKCIGYYLRQSTRPIEILSVNYDLLRAKEAAKSHGRGWVLSAGYRETPEFQAWMQSFDPIHRSRKANLQLFYFPDFSSFLSAPGRIERLKSVLAEDRESSARQDFSQSELLLGAGWSYPERSPDGMTFRWAIGRRAEMALLTPTNQRLQALRLRLLPFPSPDRPTQTFGVTINSQVLPRITLDPVWKEITLAPIEGSREANLVTFDFAWSQSPQELDAGSPDACPLAAAFDFVEVIPPDTEPKLARTIHEGRSEKP